MRKIAGIHICGLVLAVCIAGYTVYVNCRPRIGGIQAKAIGSAWALPLPDINNKSIPSDIQSFANTENYGWPYVAAYRWVDFDNPTIYTSERSWFPFAVLVNAFVLLGIAMLTVAFFELSVRIFGQFTFKKNLLL